MFETIIHRGTLMAVLTLVICVLGIVAALKIPVQMIPDLEVRTISIRTSWPGATPQDIEKEILIEQEEHLRSVPSLQRIVSTARFGSARIEMEFPFGVNLNDTLINVSNALSQVPSYPNNVNEPRIYATSFSANSFMYYRVMPLDGNPRNLDMIPMQDFIEDNVASRMETVKGVSEVRTYGGAERQVQVLIDPARLAALNLTVAEVRDSIRQRNRDISGGEIESGKRRYLLRTIGRFKNLDELKQMIISRRGDAVTRLGDVADIRLGHFEVSRISYTDGNPIIGMSVRRQTGSNVIDIKRELTREVEAINREVLHPAGMKMRLIADDVGYVEASIFNVWKNLAIGAVLASLVMFLFLRSGPATLVGIMGIPVCTIAAFLGLLMAERTINVISLAGVAFAIGMTLDNSIVVLESIEMARRRGMVRVKAAIDGVSKVWPAILASTLTTILVFIPIVFIVEEAGQLYSDIAIAISASILASMLVAITVLPPATARLEFSNSTVLPHSTPYWNERIVNWVSRLLSSRTYQLSVLSVTVLITLGVITFLMPAAEYLPEGEEPKAFASMSSPPGYNLETMARIGKELQDYFLPYLNHEPEQFDSGETSVPAMAYMNISIESSRIRIITQPKNPTHIKALMNALRDKYETYPAMRAFVSRGSIITSNNGGSRSVSLDISGPSLEEIYKVASLVDQRAKEVFDKPRVRANPSTLTLSQPLVEVRPRWDRLAEIGMPSSDLGFTVSAMTDGTFVDEFFLDDDKIDIYLYSQKNALADLDNLDQLPVYTPNGTTVPLSSLVTISETVDTNSIRRVDGKRTVTLNVIPPDNIALETGVAIVKQDVIRFMRDNGSIPNNINITISGASDQLDATREALTANYTVALIIIYLLLVAIFTHWGYPLLIMTTIPLGVAGGIVGLWLFNLIGGWLPIVGIQEATQSFDMITMLGFLILMGTVVNNPILIVHLAMVNTRNNGMNAREAIIDAVDKRLRPIAMSTLTTICGLAPLVFLPGEGTELYRGVGIIVLFGLLGTAIVSVTFLPALTMLFLERARPKDAPSLDGGIDQTG